MPEPQLRKTVTKEARRGERRACDRFQVCGRSLLFCGQTDACQARKAEEKQNGGASSGVEVDEGTVATKLSRRTLAVGEEIVMKRN